MQVPCPSGLVFNARHWKIGDQRVLLDTLSKGTHLPYKMVAIVAQDVVDPGPYDMEAGGPVDVEQMTNADITTANIIIRAGKKPIMSLQPSCARCGKIQRGVQDIPLDELSVFLADAEGIEHLGSNMPVERRVGDGTRVFLKAVRGRDTANMAKLQEQEEEAMLEIMSCMHIAEIRSSLHREPLRRLPEIRKFWNEQDWDFRDVVEEGIDTLWGGIDLMYRFTCDHMSCNTEQEQALPLDLSFYGLDLVQRQRRRAKRSSVKSVHELMQKASSPSSPESQNSRDST
jgi:hypothetical protein